MLRKREVPIDIAFNAACRENDLEFKRLANNREVNEIAFLDEEGNKCFFAKNVNMDPLMDQKKHSEGLDQSTLKAQEIFSAVRFLNHDCTGTGC
jgi:hypothetical protein